MASKATMVKTKQIITHYIINIIDKRYISIPGKQAGHTFHFEMVRLELIWKQFGIELGPMDMFNWWYRFPA